MVITPQFFGWSNGQTAGSAVATLFFFPANKFLSRESIVFFAERFRSATPAERTSRLF
jgi:hypothetical protein